MPECKVHQLETAARVQALDSRWAASFGHPALVCGERMQDGVHAHPCWTGVVQDRRERDPGSAEGG